VPHVSCFFRRFACKVHHRREGLWRFHDLGTRSYA
jgi:hypothetical protein